MVYTMSKTNEFYLQGLNVWPRPLTLAEIDKHICEYGHQLEAWDTRKLKHIQYWRDRFGLDDAKPFAMQMGTLVSHICWEKVFRADTSSYYLKVITSHEGLSEFYPYNNSQHDKLFNKILTHASANGLTFARLPEGDQGSLAFFSLPRHTHDWLVWQKSITDKSSLPGNTIRRSIKAYREGNLPDVGNLAELERMLCK